MKLLISQHISQKYIIELHVGTVPDSTKNNIVDQASYNRYSVLGEIDWLEDES